MWCLWHEWNARNLDDHETSLLDLKKSMLHTLYTGRVAWTISPISTFCEFLDLCSFSSMG
jgi:hypothetical protein